MLRCHDCGRTDQETRFSRLARRRCADCKAKGAAAKFVQPGKGGAPKKGRKKPGENGHHLAWIRTFPCVASVGCGSLTHAHHVRSNTDGGTGMKPEDRWAVPLCPKHHIELHQTGVRTFEAKHGVDLRALALQFAERSPFLATTTATAQ